VSVAVTKMGVVLHQAWSESQWTVLLGYFTWLCYWKCCWWQFCLWARQCTGAYCVQRSPTVAVHNSQLPFSWATAP